MNAIILALKLQLFKHAEVGINTYWSTHNGFSVVFRPKSSSILRLIKCSVDLLDGVITLKNKQQ